MKSPTVSFVVPCYKMAHLLPECINSITAQSFRDLEVLIMDDCSPDNTPEIAYSFLDPRVKHVRNVQNLGHLRNYNKGINLSRGKYVWLISADDYLRKPYILEKYVDCLERHPNVGYVFCCGFGVRDGIETGLMGRYSVRGDCDRVIPGHVLLEKLLTGNFVLAPSGLVRRECYEKISLFPLDMPWAGDWYLWCLFALYCDVGYFAEPMVCYREHHALSMTTTLLHEKLDACGGEEIAIPWLIAKKAREAGYPRVAKLCLSAVAHSYARTLARERYRSSASYMNLERVEESIRQHTTSEAERKWLRSRVLGNMGDECYWQGDLRAARNYYQVALKEDPWMAAVQIKRALLALGKPGDSVRRLVLSFR